MTFEMPDDGRTHVRIVEPSGVQLEGGRRPFEKTFWFASAAICIRGKECMPIVDVEETVLDPDMLDIREAVVEDDCELLDTDGLCTCAAAACPGDFEPPPCDVSSATAAAMTATAATTHGVAFGSDRRCPL